MEIENNYLGRCLAALACLTNRGTPLVAKHSKGQRIKLSLFCFVLHIGRKNVFKYFLFN